MRAALSHRAKMAVVLWVLALTGCGSMNPVTQQWNPPRVGATWELAQKNTGSYGKDTTVQITRGQGRWNDQEVITFANSSGPTTMADPQNGRWLAIVGRDGKPIMSWSPALGWSYPMKVGDAWTTAYRLTLATGKVLDYDLKCHIDSYSEIQVKAGTFPAYKIMCTSTIGNEEIYWNSPTLGIFIKTQLRRTDKSPFGAGTQEAELISQNIRP